MKRPIWIACLLCVAIAVGLIAVLYPKYHFNALISAALREGRIEDARVLMHRPHNLEKIVAALPRQADVIQAALDVQFKYAYIEKDDTNYAYPENLTVFKSLVDVGARPRFHHLLAAAEQGKMATVDYFMRLGVPIQEQGASETPLSGVAYSGDSKLLTRMIESGADITFARSDGWTPLLAAAWSGKVECVKVLLNKGADVYAPFEDWKGNQQPAWKVIEERAAHVSADDSRLEVWKLVAARKSNSEQDGGGQPPTRSESK